MNSINSTNRNTNQIEMRSREPSSVTLEMGDDQDPSGPRAGGAVNWAANQARNVGLATARNLASVAIPTFAREMARRTLFEQMANAMPAAAVTGSLVAGGALPVGLQMAGIYRDAVNQTQTRTSLASRLGSIALTGGTLVGLAAAGGAPALAAAAPALMAANFVYTPLRDAVQYNLRLGDNTRSTPERPATARATFASAAAYVGNQTAVGIGMDTAGAAAAAAFQNIIPGAGVATSWAEGLAKGLGQGVARAGMNVVGETVDEMTLRGMQSLTAGTTNGETLQLSLGLRNSDDRTSTARQNATLTTHAGRQSLFASAFNATYAAEQLGVTNIYAANAVTAGVLGTAYPAFVHMHASNAQNTHEVEAQTNRPENSVSSSAVGQDTMHEERETARSERASRRPSASSVSSTVNSTGYETSASSSSLASSISSLTPALTSELNNINPEENRMVTRL